jgi:hypothetical protein
MRPGEEKMSIQGGRAKTVAKLRQQFGAKKAAELRENDGGGNAGGDGDTRQE